MAIIDLQRNHGGIQSLVTQFANYAAAGQGAMLNHTDGYVYCVFARNYLNGVANERRLYVTRSNDAGLTWTAAIEISTGNWDDDPALIQLDATDVNSDIGVVFSRSDTLTRFTFDKETGGYTSPYDAIEYPGTTPIVSKKWPSIIHTGTEFQIWCLVRDGITTPAVYQYSNANLFTDNTWVGAAKTIFPANGQPMSLSVKRLANGHLAMVGAYRTNLNGQAQAESLLDRPGMSNLPKGMLRCDVGAFFSADAGATWTSVQAITSYAGTPALDLVGIMSVAAADLHQLSDSTIVVAYQEHTAPQYIDAYTSPISEANIPSCIRYHTGKNALIYGIHDITLGGVFVIDLTAQTSVRIQSPTLWTDKVIDLDISPDETKMAVALSDGGINILDITDSDPTNWTIIVNGSLRTTSTPALASNNIVKVRWDGNANIAFSYLNTYGGFWGGYYDIGAQTLVNLDSAQSNTVVADFVVQATAIITGGSYYSGSTLPIIEAVSKTTGLGLYHYHPASVPANIYYDTAHSEYLALYGNGTMARLSDTGSAFSVLQAFTPTSNPSWAVNTLYGAGMSVEIPGQGILVYDYQANQHLWYSYVSQQPAGYRNQAYRLGLGENVNYSQLSGGGGLKGNTWLALIGNACLVLQNLVNVGRIRYGIFPYDATNKQLLPAGVDFYDVCNVNKVGTNMTSLQFPKFCADTDDRLYWYFCRWDLLQPGGNEFAPVLGVVEPDSVKISMLARILQGGVHTFSGRGRIQVTTTATLSARMRIVFAQCLKMRARIVPRQLTTLSLRASILGSRSSTCHMSFSVQGTGSSRVRATFYVNTGRVGGGSLNLTFRAYIVKSYAARMTGHFIVRVPAAPGKLSFVVLGTTAQVMTMRARIGMG